MIGNGSEVPKLLSKIYNNKLTNIELIKQNEFSIKTNIYNKFDVGITSLKAHKTFKTVIPSKIYDYASNGLTTLFVGPKGDASDLIMKYSLGVVSSPNSKDLKEKFLKQRQKK